MKVWLRWLLSKLGLADYFIPAFRFQCECGRSVAMPVPKDGTTIRINCACGTRNEMMWTGAVWKFQSSTDEQAKPLNLPGHPRTDEAR
jgi:hypothetical protein